MSWEENFFWPVIFFDSHGCIRTSVQRNSIRALIQSSQMESEFIMTARKQHKTQNRVNLVHQLFVCAIYSASKHLCSTYISHSTLSSVKLFPNLRWIEKRNLLPLTSCYAKFNTLTTPGCNKYKHLVELKWYTVGKTREIEKSSTQRRRKKEFLSTLITQLLLPGN